MKVRDVFGSKSSTASACDSGTPNALMNSNSKEDERSKEQFSRFSQHASRSRFSGSPSTNITNQHVFVANMDGSIRVGRFLFVCCLLIAAVVLATLSFYLLRGAEEQLAQLHFDSVADRTLAEMSGILLARRWATIAMASMVSEILPNASSYPFVAVPGYERIASEGLNSTRGEHTTVALFVSPEHLPEWEDFAYDFFHNQHGPQPFPNTTATSMFGQGVWGIQKSGDRYRDSGQCVFGDCAFQILAPVFHSSNGPDPILMYNIYSDPVRGLALEHMVRCVQDVVQQLKEDSNQSNTSGLNYTATTNPYSFQDKADLACGIMMPIQASSPFRSDDDGGGPGPSSEIFQPIRPVGDRTKVVGLVVGITPWYSILDNVFPETVQGVDCVISSQYEDYTFSISSGKVALHGKGDHHKPEFESQRKSTQLMDEHLFSKISPIYILSIYPSVEFYDSYQTRNPRVALLGTLCIMLFTSLFFYFYDACVRKDLVAKKQLLEAKRRFMRFVSHEVRTPLNSVCMGLDIISSETKALAEYMRERNRDDQTTLEQAEECVCLVDEVQTSAQSAVDVLNDILNYDKIDRRDLSLEIDIIPVWDFLGRVVNEFRLPAATKKLALEWHVQAGNVQGDPKRGSFGSIESLPQGIRTLCVVGDIVRLKQVLRNLISNAIKFTPEGGSVCIRAVARKDQINSVLETIELRTREKMNVRHIRTLQLTVTDTGAGMTREQLRKLFGEGVQFNANELQKGGGSGLGLWISKGIVERHEGTLIAKSAGLDKGTTFVLQLPLYQTQDNQQYPLSTFEQERSQSLPLDMDAEAGKFSASGSNKLRLLIVDDVSSNRKLLRRLLEMKGHICEDAVNGQVAIEMVQLAAQTKAYDSVLMDYEMPVMDGPTATKMIRSMGYDVFVVGVTGNMLDEDVDYFRRCGANAVTGKPVKLETLEDLWVEYGLLSGNIDPEEKIGAEAENEEHAGTLVQVQDKPPEPR